MSKADEIFEEKGFIKTKDDSCWCEYIKENTVKLSFEKNIKKLFIESIEDIPEDDYEHKDLEKIVIIDIDLLQAIIEKCKELGYLELNNPFKEIKDAIASFGKMPVKIKMKEKYYNEVFIKNVKKVSSTELTPFQKFSSLPLEIDDKIKSNFEVVYE